MTSPLIPVFTESGSVCLDIMKWNSKTVNERKMLSNTCTTHTFWDKQATFCKLFFTACFVPSPSFLLPSPPRPSLQVPRHTYQWIPVHSASWSCTNACLHYFGSLNMSVWTMCEECDNMHTGYCKINYYRLM